MANAFLITPSELLESGKYIVPDHLDGVKNNNNWKNLEWVNQAENVGHMGNQFTGIMTQDIQQYTIHGPV